MWVYVFVAPLWPFGQEIPSGVSIAHWGQALRVCILLPELGMLKKNEKTRVKIRDLCEIKPHLYGLSRDNP